MAVHNRRLDGTCINICFLVQHLLYLDLRGIGRFVFHQLLACLEVEVRGIVGAKFGESERRIPWCKAYTLGWLRVGRQTPQDADKHESEKRPEQATAPFDNPLHSAHYASVIRWKPAGKPFNS